MPFNPSLLNSTLVKKFIDRLEKSYKERGVAVKRTSVQEDVAKMFGFASYYEMNQQLAKEPQEQIVELASDTDIAARIALRRQATLSSYTSAKTIFESKVLPFTMSSLGDLPNSLGEVTRMIARFANTFESVGKQYTQLSLDKKQHFAQELFAHYASSEGVFPITENFRTQNAANELLDVIVRKTPENEKDAVITAFFDLHPTFKPSFWPATVVFAPPPKYSDTQYERVPFVSSVLELRVPPIDQDFLNEEEERNIFQKMWQSNFASVQEVYTALPVVLKIQFIHELQDHYKHTPSRLFFKKSLGDVIVALAKITPPNEKKDIIPVLSGEDRLGLLPKRRQLV